MRVWPPWRARAWPTTRGRASAGAASMSRSGGWRWWGPDPITMVAGLHWLDLDDALTRLPALLAPGGLLLVVGLARPDSLADLAFDVVSGAANPVMGMIRHPRPAPSPPVPDGQPVMPVQVLRHHVRRDQDRGQGAPARRRHPPASVLPVHTPLGQVGEPARYLRTRHRKL